MNNRSRDIFQSAGLFVLATMAANFMNFVFNAFLGRVLNFEEYALVTLINTFWYVLSIFLGSLSMTTNHKVSFLTAKSGKGSGTSFYFYLLIRALIVAFIVSVLWLIASPFLTSFFKVSELSTLTYFAPVITLSIFTAITQGYFQGSLMFKALSYVALIDAGSKLLAAFLLVTFNLRYFVFLSVPISSFVTALGALFFYLRHGGGVSQPRRFNFPRGFFFASLLTGLASTAFLSLDVLLAKHYLQPQEAGQYALLSLVGKMIFFFGSLFNGIIISLVSRAEGKRSDSSFTFYKLFALSSFFTLNCFMALGPLGFFTVPILLGSKAHAITPLLTSYALAITFFTLSYAIVSYHLARERYFTPIASLFSCVFMILGIMASHSSVSAIAHVVLQVSFGMFFVVTTLHVFQGQGRFILRSIIDLFDVAYPLPLQQPSTPRKKRILIFNWRDTKHRDAGGAEVYLHELSKRWVKDGHTVTWFCGNDGFCKRFEVVDGVEIIRRGGFYFVYLWAFLYYIVQFRGQFDTIIDSENGIPFFTPLYAKERHFLVIHHVHQEVFKKNLPPLLSFIARFMERRFMPFVYNNTPVIAVSPSTKRELINLALTSRAPKLVYNGVDTKLFTPGEKNKNPLVLYVGRLKAYKSVDVFVKAAKQILKSVPTAQFVIAGEGEERTRLTRLAHDLGLDPVLRFVGRVTEEEKIELYKKAWVFVNPSFMEGWGITTIEANACGTPVVAADVPGLRDSVRNPHTGYLFHHGDADALAQRVVELLLHSRRRNTMSKEAVLWARKFDWETSSKRFMSIIRNRHG